MLVWLKYKKQSKTFLYNIYFYFTKQSSVCFRRDDVRPALAD